jgi:hypothetical protein
MIPQELHALVPKLVKLSRDYENGRCLFVCTKALQIRSVGIHMWIGAHDRNITIFEDEKQTTEHPEAKGPGQSLQYIDKEEPVERSIINSSSDRSHLFSNRLLSIIPCFVLRGVYGIHWKCGILLLTLDE